MRDPARIDRVAAKLVTAWKLVPDWRLCQLISNSQGPGNHGDMFYSSDDLIERGLDDLIAQYSKPASDA